MCGCRCVYIYIYACMYVCMYVHPCTTLCIYIYLHCAWMYMYDHRYSCIHIYVHQHVFLAISYYSIFYVQTLIQRCYSYINTMYACMQVCMYVCMYYITLHTYGQMTKKNHQPEIRLYWDNSPDEPFFQ